MRPGLHILQEFLIGRGLMILVDDCRVFPPDSCSALKK